MSLKYLITGATGGLGSEVLKHIAANVPASEFAAASSSESKRKEFEDRGIPFRVASFDDPKALEESFTGVENLFFVSTNTFDVEKRMRQHQNVINAAKKVGVKHVWYTSLAFGGLRSDSKVNVQQAHLVTEQLLRDSGITFTSIREGIYVDAFPLLLDWYPDTETIRIPSDGPMALTSRKELGEANAKLMIRGGYENQLVLLTAGEAVSLSELVNVINETTGRHIKVEKISSEEYVRSNSANDPGKKNAWFFQTRLSWFEGITRGDAGTTDPLMADLLGREPTMAREAVCAFLKENPNYTWHQNYAKQG